MEIKLSGKWKYSEVYAHGEAGGELILEQDGDKLKGRLIFTDRPEDGTSYMIQEFLSGTLDDMKVRLEANEFDIIHSDQDIDYELDSWFGIMIDSNMIVGVSVDDQGVEGNFIFERIVE